jgi:hypothetical protein
MVITIAPPLIKKSLTRGWVGAVELYSPGFFSFFSFLAFFAFLNLLLNFLLRRVSRGFLLLCYSWPLRLLSLLLLL